MLSAAVDKENGTHLAAALQQEWEAMARDDEEGETPSPSPSLTALPQGEPLMRSTPRGMAATMERSRRAARQTARPR